MKHLIFVTFAALGLLSAGCSDLTSPSPITITKEVQVPEVSPAAQKAANPAAAQPNLPGGVLPMGKRAPEGAPLPAAAPAAAGCGG